MLYVYRTFEHHHIVGSLASFRFDGNWCVINGRHLQMNDMGNIMLFITYRYVPLSLKYQTVKVFNSIVTCL